MIDLSTTDYLVIVVYLLGIAGVSVIFRARRFKQMFGEEKKPGWLLLAASLLMIEWSPMTDMMSMGLILDNGYSGIWLLKSRFWLAGVPAILYATMWSRLVMQTDNELIRLRFSGSSGLFLHVFRAIFLALFVIPLFGSFIILALRKLFDVVHIGSFVNAEMILIAGVLLLVLKNSFRQKIRTDFVSALVCLAAPVLICFFIFKSYGGVEIFYDALRVAATDETRLIPSLDTTEGGSFADFFVFIFIQWWSVNIVDNSDPNAQRHFQAKDQFTAFKTLFLPILITSLMFLFVSTIWDCGLLEYKLNDYGSIDKEAFYLQVALQYLPDGCKALVLIAIVFSFVTTLESIINWGGGLLTVDIIKTYLHKDGTDRQYTVLSLAAMFLVSLIALLFAFNSDKILNLQKFIFSISAGVAPVFMLRWFWWRINAWTQISAMLSSLVYTLIYDFLYDHNAGFTMCIDSFADGAGLSLYPLKIVILTLLVVLTWLTVMYCTAPDDKNHLQRFVRQTGTGGIWPKGFVRTGNYNMRRRLFLCLIFALTYILPFIFIWQFKFGDVHVGTALLLLFVALVGYVYRSMSLLLGAEGAGV
jgi:Na+/proline symporter